MEGGDGMSYVKNREDLLEHGCQEAREVTIKLLEKALAKADPYLAVKNLISLENETLTVGCHTFDLNKAGNIYVVGAGKATYPIAKALEEILGDRINNGIVICKYGQDGELDKIDMRMASHPIPDEAGCAAAKDIYSLAEDTKPGDIIFAAFTGGSTALLPYPVDGVSLEDKKVAFQVLLYSGANIYEMNAVRKHLSKIKGGNLARLINPEAHLINLTVSDVTGDELDYITCPTVPDTSTLEMARTALTKYELWEKMPESIQHYFKNAGPEAETPKDKDLAEHKTYNFILVPSNAACMGAYEAAEELGIKNRMILSTVLEGEGREVGGTFADIAREILVSGNPMNAPCVIIGGGESTVSITGECGEGGPNQEFALGAALRLDGMENVVIASVDSDGTDGPTNLAGAMVDKSTLERARAEGIDLFAALMKHDVSGPLEQLGEVVITGATGTNVNDLKLMVVM